MKTFLLSRRDFLKATGLTGAGLMLGGGWIAAAAKTRSSDAFVPSVYLRIDPAEGIAVYIPAPEVGTNIRTALTMSLADELDVDIHVITVHQAPPDPVYGHQVTGGSRSIRTHFETFRKVGAHARARLVAAAAAEWEVSADRCIAENGSVIHPDGTTRLSYLELATAAAAIPDHQVVWSVKSDSFRYIGQNMRALEAEEIARGKTVFGMDAMTDGMRVAVCLRPPVKGASLSKWDAAAALALPGVVAVEQFGNKLGVIAEDSWTAMRAADRVETDWDVPSSAKVSSNQIKEQIEQGLKTPAQEMKRTGDIAAGFSGASQVFELTASAPIIAHAPMEPPVCAARITGDAAEIWLDGQNYNSVRNSLPRLTGLPLNRITVHPLRVGGGFGGKLRQDFMEEAIELARLVDYPVKVMYTRTDDLRHDRFRPPVAFRLKAGLAENGKPLAFDFTTSGDLRRMYGDGYLDLAPNYVYHAAQVDIPLDFGPLRAPGHNAKIVLWEGFIDELASRSNIDPLTYRLALYGDPEALEELGWDGAPVNRPHLTALLRRVKSMAGWRSRGDVGYGVATFEGYGSSIALVALVPRRQTGKAAERVFAAVDCGRVVNPLGARAQVEGGIIDGIGAALLQEITLTEGRVDQSNFHNFRMLRFDQAPEVETVFMEGGKTAQGLGEVPYPPALAAFCNAVAAASGERKAALPIGG